MLNQQTISSLKQLYLHGMVTAYEMQLSQPANLNLSFDERFSMLVEEELLHRKNNTMERLIKRAKMRYRACVEDIDYNSKRGVSKEQMANLVTCTWLLRKQGCIITGATGTGKSWLACAIGHQACRMGVSVLYVKVSMLFEKLKEVHLTGKYVNYLQSLSKVGLLILDDWGMETFEERRALDIQEILEDRYNEKSTLITSQFPVTKWHEIIGNRTLADAIVDRVIHNSIRLELKGESKRKKQETKP